MSPFLVGAMFRLLELGTLFVVVAFYWLTEAHRVGLPWITIAVPFVYYLLFRRYWDTTNILLGFVHREAISCPTCEQLVFDPTPDRSYRTYAHRDRFLPRKICADCGHDNREAFPAGFRILRDTLPDAKAVMIVVLTVGGVLTIGLVGLYFVDLPAVDQCLDSGGVWNDSRSICQH